MLMEQPEATVAAQQSAHAAPNTWVSKIKLNGALIDPLTCDSPAIYVDAREDGRIMPGADTSGIAERRYLGKSFACLAYHKH